jgi:hypothetical protein
MMNPDAECGQCAYYAKRPPEVAARCCLDGVCLKTARATDSHRKATIGGCGTAFVIGTGQIARGFRRREA